MGLLASLFSNFRGKNSGTTERDERSNFIFYKIVDFRQDHKTYLLQCINTKAVFQANISQIVDDCDILYGLHPIQACYVGMEFAKFIKKKDPSSPLETPKNCVDYSIHRYGHLHIQYLDRKGNICFLDEQNQQEYVMDPKDISLSEELIQEFDAAQSFYIGLQANMKVRHPASSALSLKKNSPYLRVIK